MRTLAFVQCVCVCLLTALACASESSLWAFDAGPDWAEGQSIVLGLEPLTLNLVDFPPDRMYLQGAHYDVSRSLLYVSGGYADDPYWYNQNTIHLYSGGPGQLIHVSSSNRGTSDFNWLGDIACLGDSLYAIAFDGPAGDNNEPVVLLRITDPATPEQDATQVGDPLGTVGSLGVPFSLCPDGRGALFSVFRESRYPDIYNTRLCRLDPSTGQMTVLHTYFDDQTVKYIEGLTMLDGELYGLNTDGAVFRFDLETYAATLVADLGYGPWTGLVTIPEPSTISAVGLALVVGVLWRRGRRRLISAIPRRSWPYARR